MIELISNELIIFITVPSESDVLTELKIFHIFEFFLTLKSFSKLFPFVTFMQN